MQLFDLIKTMFQSPSKYSEISSLIKKRNFFMINRRMSIQFPIQASAFNKMKISSGHVVDLWQTIAAKQGSVPKWMYLKTKSGKSATSGYKPSDETLSMYLKINKIGIRDYEDAIKLNKVAVMTQLKSLEKSIKTIK